MKVLLTNDDGIGSDGLRVMAEAISVEHEVWIVAPDSERSGISHAITLREAVRIRRHDERSFSCDGTTADCVLYALLGALPVRPQAVISGINHGPNIGTDIIYSGTVGGARQAALMGLPGIAVSMADQRSPYDFPSAARFVSENLALLVDLWHPDHFININVPDGRGRPLHVVVTHPARRIYRDELVDFTAPNGERYYFLTGASSEAVTEPGSDWAAVTASAISVSPIYLHPVNHEEDDAYHRAVFSVPSVG